MKQTFFIILSFTFSILGFGQDPELPYYEITNGIRLNTEVIRPILSIVQENYTAYEFNVDVGIKPRLFLSVDVGVQDHLQADSLPSFSYQTTGTFFKIGIDRNFINFENSVTDIVSLGARYGYASLSQTISNAIVYNEYWGNSDPISTTENFQAHWLEVVVGMKTPIFKNVYIGWDIRGKMLLYNGSEVSKRPYITGFGKPSATTLRLGSSFHYYISYRLPFKNKWQMEKSIFDKKK